MYFFSLSSLPLVFLVRIYAYTVHTRARALLLPFVATDSESTLMLITTCSIYVSYIAYAQRGFLILINILFFFRCQIICSAGATSSVYYMYM